jgi:hypothetical protein
LNFNSTFFSSSFDHSTLVAVNCCPEFEFGFDQIDLIASINAVSPAFASPLVDFSLSMIF